MVNAKTPLKKYHQKANVEYTSNPYEPSSKNDRPKTWPNWLASLFGPPEPQAALKFNNGDPIICHGIEFCADPNNIHRLYASSPSATHTRERMNLITAEAIRYLPKFIEQNPNLIGCLKGRQLVIRMTHAYGGWQAECIFEHPLDWDILQFALD